MQGTTTNQPAQPTTTSRRWYVYAVIVLPFTALAVAATIVHPQLWWLLAIVLLMTTAVVVHVVPLIRADAPRAAEQLRELVVRPLRRWWNRRERHRRWAVATAHGALVAMLCWLAVMEVDSTWGRILLAATAALVAAAMVRTLRRDVRAMNRRRRWHEWREVREAWENRRTLGGVRPRVMRRKAMGLALACFLFAGITMWWALTSPMGTISMVVTVLGALAAAADAYYLAFSASYRHRRILRRLRRIRAAAADGHRGLPA